MPTDKQQLRQIMRERRQSLTIYQQRQAAKKVNNHFCRSAAFLTANHIAFYLPNDGEISPEKLIETALNSDKKCYLPVITQNGKLQFKHYMPGDKLIKNKYGIPEPMPNKPLIPTKQLDLVLMPLVAFDDSGNRLGMGGGFYDRTFANKLTMPNVKLIGLAHEQQKADKINADEWDVPLNGILTDKGFKTF